MAASKGNPALDPLWERVCVIFDKWVELLDLDWCDITFYRSDSAHEDGFAADCAAKWQYRHAIVRVYLPAIANHTDGDIEGIIVHELCHILLNPVDSVLPRKFSDQCELATENVARAFLALYRDKLKP